MTNEQQLTNLQLSQKLEKLEVKQESLWYWYKQVGGFICDREVAGQWIIRSKKDYPDKGLGGYISAFTVAELGEMLPDDVESYHRYKNWTCGEHRMMHWEHAKTEANARAKMLIYLLKNGLIK